MKSKEIIIGLLAHVDAGKTTLAESLLFETGKIRKQGRVDHKDTFLDNNENERKRGITIFSKQALIEYGTKKIVLLDTPGHVDFSTEMERTLQVLDYAILVISASEGVQSHTKTLWKLLEYYNIPTFIFINKMDIQKKDKHIIKQEIEKKLSKSCIEYIDDENIWNEEAALINEKFLTDYLENGIINNELLIKEVSQRQIFPIVFGAALKNEGIEQLLTVINKFTEEKDYPEQFSARIYKIDRDQQNNRLTHMKITGGTLKVKTELTGGDVTPWKEKINQIRVYSGDKFESYEEMTAGSICTVTGLTKTYSGEGIGCEKRYIIPVLKPVMTYRIMFKDADEFSIYKKLKVLEEEDAALHIEWNEKFKEIEIQIMGSVQIEIIKSIIKERFELDAEFSEGSIIYKETINNPVIGIGHFEPLKHYAEVHVLIEPLERGSGIQYESAVSEDMLDKNWQRLILTNLKEKTHKGILTGSDLTDVKFSIINGKAHIKHTEGGDFRQATYRSVRQGLMSGESILLEPYYYFQIEVPQEYVGRVMTDITIMSGSINDPMIENGIAFIEGTCPVATLKDYAKEIVSFSHGEGKINLQVKGYDICHNMEEVIEKSLYIPEADIENTADSVFCAHGAGFVVPWYDVPNYAHVSDEIKTEKIEKSDYPIRSTTVSDFISQEEIDDIMQRTYGDSKKERSKWKRINASDSYHVSSKTTLKKKKEKHYLLVDGYNIIFAWPELSEIAKINIDSARDKLIDIMCNYQGYSGYEIILVYDAYKVTGGQGTQTRFNNIDVVYTKEAQTADSYIEKTTKVLIKEYDVTVATSDGLEQMIIFGTGANRLSAKGLYEEVNRINMDIGNEIYLNNRNNKLKNDFVNKLEEVKESVKENDK